ncbi:hypothetical protein B0H14DRAFT_2502202, partial [Mycena olivaceomarginata]
MNLYPVVPNGTVSQTAPSVPQPEPQPYGMMGPDSEPAVYSESGIYSNLLLCRGRGFPLYRPEPRTRLPEEYRRTGVAIGDVGTVTVEGDFDFFFNIYLPANDPINIDAPKDFVPLLAYPWRDIGDYRVHPGDHVSTAIHKLSGFSNSAVGGEFVFECAGPHGAVLALPHGAHLQKLENLASMERHAVKYAQSWYRYVRETRGRKLQNGSLLLITGCEKARSWGIASFHHLSLQHKFQLSFKPTTNAKSGYKYRWEGPYCYHKQADSPPAEETPLNQTIFIHAFTISLPENIWKRPFGDRAKVRQLADPLTFTDKSGHGFVSSGSQGLSLGLSPRDRTPTGGRQYSLAHGSQGSLLGSVFSGSAHTGGSTSASNGGRQYSGQDGIISNASPIPKIFHPSQVIHKYLLHEAPHATVVITHDNDWRDALMNHEVPLTEQEFIQAIFARFEITVEDGEVFLRAK